VDSDVVIENNDNAIGLTCFGDRTAACRESRFRSP